MEIQKIKADETNKVADLFCECFFDDGYYKKIFPDPVTRKKEMRDNFYGSISYCINLDGCFGIYDGDVMIAFVLTFDYDWVKQNNKAEFEKIFGCENSKTNLLSDSFFQEQIKTLNGKKIFCLSVAVAAEYRNMGLGACMIDCIMQEFSGCHIIGDVSNGESLSIYKKRNFSVREISADYYLVAHDAKDCSHTFECTENVRAAVPCDFDFGQYDIDYKLLKPKFAICGYETVNSNGICCFKAKKGGIALSRLVEFKYHDFLKFQRAVNISACSEILRGDFVFFALDGDNEALPLFNDNLKEMIQCRKAEWSIVPDVFVSIPVRYESIEKITSGNAGQDDKTEALLKMLDFRTNYELGIFSKNDSVDELSNCKKRIKRYYLGKIKVQISSEITLEQYDSIGTPIGNCGYVDLYISIDQESDCGVLSWYSLSTPFLISHYLDNIIRNQLMVADDEGFVNIFDYVNSKYGIVKRGTPKNFVIIPYEKDVLSASQTASLISAETIYPDGENFGGIIDSEILNIVNSKQGMGQYDRAYVYAYSNVVLQFSPELRGTLSERLNEESITLFYIELILYQEAAIHIADRAIASLFTTTQIAKPIDFLMQVDLIHDNYSKTIDFWDINVNYPTSQKSINMLRKAFKIQEQREYMLRNQEHLNLVFETKCDISDRNDTKRMDKSLAIISVLAIFSAWVDSHAFIQIWGGSLENSTVELLQRIVFFIILIIAGYAIILLIAGRFSNLINRRKKKNIRSKSDKENKKRNKK